MLTRSAMGPTGWGCGWGWSRRRNRRRLVPLLVAASITASCLIPSGCASPEPKYEVTVDEDAVCVKAKDLGVPARSFADSGRRRLEERPSVNRFPAGVSVVRVAAMMDEQAAHRHLRVAEMARHSAVYWNHLWDDLPPIREVSMLRTLGLDPRGARYQDILRESINANCDLCLIYADVADTNAHAELVAVLWDAANHLALETFRVPVTLPDEVLEEYKESEGGGRWVDEAEHRAETDLRLLVRNAMWDIVMRDQATATTQQSPWRQYLPMLQDKYDRLRQIERALERSGD